MRIKILVQSHQAGPNPPAKAWGGRSLQVGTEPGLRAGADRYHPSDARPKLHPSGAAASQHALEMREASNPLRGPGHPSEELDRPVT
jgi:hypothetical protein